MGRSLLRALAALLAAATSACGPADDERPLNLLFVLSDQHRGDTLGCAGHPLVQTPHLDRLASAGVRFANAVVQAPLCVPQRASLFTGRYAQLHRATHNACVLPEEELTWAEHLRGEGYATVSVGRVHGVYDGCEHVAVAGKETIREPESEDAPPVPEEEHWDTRIADVALEQLAELADAGRPWALYVGFFSPHSPYFPPSPYDGMYDLKQIKPERYDPARQAGQPSWQRDNVRLENLHSASAKRRLAGYYGLTSHLDHQVGRLLDALDELELAERTLVVYTSDHGAPHGEHGFTRKNVSFYEGGVVVPAMLRLPGRLPAGRVVEPVVESIDLVPTMLALLGVDVPPAFVGTDLRPLAHGEAEAARGYAFASIDFTHQKRPEERGLMVRTDGWKLCWYTTGEGELFDLAADPGELQNLYGDAAHFADRDRHWALLVEHLIWTWSLVPGREVRSPGVGRGDVTLLAAAGDAPGVRVRSGGWELERRAGGGGHLFHLASDPGRSRDRFADPASARRHQELEELLVGHLAYGLGPPNHRDPDDGRCFD